MGESVLIMGGGPAGTASAMNLLHSGFQPVIIEADAFPRFHIGESLTTECVDALNRLGLQDQMITLAAPRKKGVRIFSRHEENSFYVGAGDAWQVERARFDCMMLNTAVERGAKYIHGKALGLFRKGGEWRLEVRLANGRRTELRARFAIDATGQQRFSQRQGLIGPLREGNYARQVAFFSQYKQVVRRKQDAFDTLIHHSGKYEWVWLIPLSESTTSIGLVVPVDTYRSEKARADAYLDSRLRAFSEPLTERVDSALRIGKVRTVSNYSYQIDHYARDGLFCVGDSHGFVDPIFSFGVEFAVLEAEYAAKAIKECQQSDGSEWSTHARRYMEVTGAAQKVIEDLLAYFWAHPWGFANMAHVRHQDEFLELFAGRIYEIEPGAGLKKMRASLV